MVASVALAAPARLAFLPTTAAVASTLEVRLTPASALPENVTSAWATPAARTSDVVVRRMRLVYDTFELK